MLSFSSPLVGPMFDYSSFNSKRWDWANVENLSEPNLWIIKTFPCLFLQSPFFLRNLYSETFWHILLLPWFGWWGGSGKIDREESSLRSWNNKSCGWPARYPNQESDHHPNNQFWNFTKQCWKIEGDVCGNPVIYFYADLRDGFEIILINLLSHCPNYSSKSMTHDRIVPFQNPNAILPRTAQHRKYYSYLSTSWFVTSISCTW